MLYILFYSNYCKFCEAFVRYLEDSGESGNFAKLCVDKDQYGQRNQMIYNYGITEVPTIIVENTKKLPGISAFQWLKHRIDNSEMAVNSMHTRGNRHPENILNEVDPSRLKSYNDTSEFPEEYSTYSLNSNAGFGSN